MENKNQDTPSTLPLAYQTPQTLTSAATKESKADNLKKDKKHLKIVICALILLALGVYGLSTFKIIKPWKDYEGKVCNFGGCYTSETNQKYEYWKDQAIKKRKPDLCNNVEGIDGGDYFTSKEMAIMLCKLYYAIETRDIDYCQSFTGYMVTRCLGGIAVKYNMPELLSEKDCEQYKGKDFSDCINLLVKVKDDDSYCNLLATKKDWFGEQMCRQYAGVKESRIDNARSEITLNNLPELIQKCSSYKVLKNKMTCYVDIQEGLRFKVGGEPVEEYCRDNMSDNPDITWDICYYLSFSGFLNIPDDIKTHVIELTQNNDKSKLLLCESIRWHTYGSKGLSDSEMKQFGIDVCGLDYLE